MLPTVCKTALPKSVLCDVFELCTYAAEKLGAGFANAFFQTVKALSYTRLSPFVSGRFNDTSVKVAKELDTLPGSYLLVKVLYFNTWLLVGTVCETSVNFFVSIELKAFTVPSHVRNLGCVLDPPEGTISVIALVPLPTSIEFSVLLVLPVPPRATETGAVRLKTFELSVIPDPAL